MRYYFGLFVFAVLSISCNKSNSVSIRGHFASSPQQKVYLDAILPEGTGVVDSAVTDDKGMFRMNVSLPDGESMLYNLRIDGDMITLLLAPGEKLDLFSICDNSHNYTVEGSPGSELIRELNTIMYGGIYEMDSLREEMLGRHHTAAHRDSLLNEYAEVYLRTKRDQIGFVMANAGSVAAIYALYQRLPNDNVLFNGASDIIYYRTVADSVGSLHPGSPYLAALRGVISRYDNANGLLMAMDEARARPVGYPEISMPDIYGDTVRLSSIRDKVILVSFWSAASAQCREANLDLKDVYAEYSPSGFEIYQVCIDKSRPLWVTAVQDQKLPWISVSDLRGSSSPAVGAYNVRSVPSSYLIDRGGNVVAKDLSADKLVAELKTRLK